MKRFAIRLSAFVLVLVLLQWLISIAFPAEIPQEVLRLHDYLSAGVDVVYLGDSTLSYPQGEVTTGQILQEMLPDLAIGEIAHPAYNLDLYLHAVRYVLRSAHRPQAIVMPINMRSFSPEWDMRPGYQFAREKQTLALGLPLARVLSRPLATFGAFRPPISQDEFLDATVYSGDIPVGKVKDFEEAVDEDTLASLRRNEEFVYHDVLPSAGNTEALQRALIYRYMGGLRPDQRQLRAMRQIVELGYENDIKILFYITPINYQQGHRFLGQPFVETLRENAHVVASLLAGSPGVSLLDLSADLEAYAFVDMEHLREAGKAYVAEQLAAAIQPGPAATPGGSDGTVVVTAHPSQQATATPATTPTRPPSPTVARTTPARTTIPPDATASTSTPGQPAPTASPAATAPVSATVATATPAPTATAQAEPRGGVLLEAEFLLRSSPGGTYPIDVYRLRYQTTDENDQISEIQADLFVPHVDEAASFPILVLAAGTTGLSSTCAPLNEAVTGRAWGNYRGQALTYAAQGFIVVLPNGFGFDDPTRIYAYFIAELEAHVLLDAARAVYGFVDHPLGQSAPARPAEKVFFMGYSSGGHAVFAAKDLAAAYAPELPVAGIVGHGATTNVETLLKEDPVFSPYIVYAYRDFYGGEIIDPADVFLQKWVPTLNSDALKKCVDDILGYYSWSPRDMYSAAFRATLYGDRLAEVFPLFAARIAANYAGVSGGNDIPVLLLQGTADIVVTPDSQRRFRDQLCSQGDNVTYLEYPAIQHFETRQTSFRDTLAWMLRVARDDVPKTNCESSRTPQ